MLLRTRTQKLGAEGEQGECGSCHFWSTPEQRLGKNGWKLQREAGGDVGKGPSGQKEQQRKGPEAGLCLVCSKTSAEASVEGGEAREEAKGWVR